MPNTSPNMGLIVPIPSTGVTGTGDTGPGYAQEISNDLLTTIDQHGHVPGQGVPIVSAALNLNADVNLQINNLTQIRATRFTSQATTFSGVGDVSELYVVNGNLYYNNAVGQAIQLTSGIATGLSATTVSTGLQYYQAQPTGTQTIGAANVQVQFAGNSSTGAANQQNITHPTGVGSGSSNFFINSNGLYEVSYRLSVAMPTGGANAIIGSYQSINATGVAPPGGVGTLVTQSFANVNFIPSGSPNFIFENNYIMSIASGSIIQTWIGSPLVSNYNVNATGTRITIKQIA